MAIALLIRKLHLLKWPRRTDVPILIGKIDSCRTINRETLPSRPRRTDPLEDFRPPTEEGADSLLKNLPILIGKADAIALLIRKLHLSGHKELILWRISDHRLRKEQILY